MTTKKKIRPGAIHLAPDEKAIIVDYEQEEYELQEGGTLGASLSKTQNTKKIKVKHINANTDVDALAQELADKCKLIKPSALGTVRDLLSTLQIREAGGDVAGSLTIDKGTAKAESRRRTDSDERRRSGDKDASDSKSRERRRTDSSDGKEAKAHKHKSRREKISSESKAAKKAQLEQERRIQAAQQQRFQQQIFEAQARKYMAADLANLDEYMEDLYEEDLSRKVHGLGMISQLFRNAANFEVLLTKKGLLQLLARTLREEYKKSMDLTINIVSVFFSMSHFSQFHSLVMDNQVGAMTMDLIDLEVQRTALRTQDQGVSPAQIAQKVMEAANGTVTLSDKEKKLISTIQKQDRLLYLCFYLLLNLAEDVTVERKMRKKNIIQHLMKMLDRSNVELLILAVTFLKKLSIYKENKDQMMKFGIIEKVNKFVPVRSNVLMMAILRLLHNLSFDQAIRDDMVAAGIVPKLVDLMQEQRFGPVCMGILYHVSMEDKHKSLFTYTQAISILYGRLLAVQDLRREPELIALAVNLTQNQRCATAMLEGQNFDKLMKKAIETQDDLLFKVMRNGSQVDDLEVKRRYSPYVEKCVMCLKDPEVTADLFVEVLGTLANLSVPEFDFQALVEKHDLLNFLAQYAKPGAVDDDILLEVVMFIGVLCNEGTANNIDGAGLVGMLFHHMGDKKDDDEFVLQITYTFAKLLQYKPTAHSLLENTDIVYYLVDLLQDKNKEVRKHADKALDTLIDTEPERATEIRELKFKTFNQEWLKVVEQSEAELQQHLMELGDGEGEGLYDDDDEHGLVFDEQYLTDAERADVGSPGPADTLDTQELRDSLRPGTALRIGAADMPDDDATSDEDADIMQEYV